MADGALRPIERIEPGDEVATPDGPKAVLLRVETARAGRELRRFEGAGFAFTATHPFVAAAGEPGRAYYAAADPSGLARAVPMLTPYGISPLDSQFTELTRYTPDGGEPWPVPPVTVDPHEESDTLHDLVLAVGEDGRSEYYAGDERVQLRVSSEVPRFGAAPDTARVLLRVLEQVTPGILDALARVPDESFADLLDIGLTSLSRTLLPAIGHEFAATAAQAGGAALGPDADASTTDSLARTAHEFARGLAAPEGGGTKRRAMTVFEQFTAAFAGQFEAALAMGWRSFNLADSDVATMLAVDLYDVELFRPLERIPESVELSLVKGAAHATRQIALRGRESSWYLTAERPGYFPEWSPTGSHADTWLEREDAPPMRIDAGGERRPTRPEHLLWELRLDLSPSADATARLPLAAVISHGYQDFEVPLLDRDAAVIGRARGDVRLLTTGAFATEWLAREKWNPEDQNRLARRLAELAAAYIAEVFPKAVEAFRFCAATTTEPTLVTAAV